MKTKLLRRLRKRYIWKFGDKCDYYYWLYVFDLKTGESTRFYMTSESRSNTEALFSAICWHFNHKSLFNKRILKKAEYRRELRNFLK